MVLENLLIFRYFLLYQKNGTHILQSIKYEQTINTINTVLEQIWYHLC